MSLDEPLDLSLLETLVNTEASDHMGIDPVEALAGKRKALEMLKHYGVYETRPRGECKHMKPIRARWEPQYNGDAVKQWRYVAQGFKWMENRDDVFAASSNAATSKMLDFVCLKERNNVTFNADVVKAYYQADQTEEVYVEAPKEFKMLMESEGMDTDVVCVLHKMLPGQRTAAAGWVAKATKTLVAMDFERCPQQPQFFFRRADKVLIEVHVDDFHGTGGREGAEQAVASLRDALDLKASDVIVHGRCSHLKQDRVKLSGETLIRPDPRYIRNLIECMGVKNAKVSPIPSLDHNEPEDALLTEDKTEASRFRSVAGLLLYVHQC